MNNNPSPSAVPARATAVLLALLAAANIIGGGWLLMLHGSPYYLVAGLGLAAIAAGLWMRSGAARPGYAAWLALTLAWSLWEVGLDWWQLVPRLWIWFVIGAWLALPWMGRSLGQLHRWTAPRQAAPLMLALLATALAGIAALLTPAPAREGQLVSSAAPQPAAGATSDWPSYGGTAAGQRYAPAAQITPANVQGLQVAWHFHTGDKPGPGDPTEITNENTPLEVGGNLYLCTPHSIAIALDAATGREKWRFDPKLQSPVGFKHFEHMTCRGVSYHDDAAYQITGQSCPQRILLPTADARLIALDANTGQPCPGFGQGGTVNLDVRVGPHAPGGYYSTSPPAVTRDLVIVGGHVSDNVSTNEPSGVIRAFDVHDGHLVWAWDSGQPDDPADIAGTKDFTHNSPNMWSVPSVDEALGLVYLPMGNQTPDQWGGQRTEASERVSAGVVALDVATGRMRWWHQFVHHDLWDMDVGGQPSLVDLDTADGRVPALVASTKQGSLYVLDRRTGKAILQVDEKPVPQGAAPGDRTAATQPMSRLSFSPPPLREADMWGSTALDQLWCRVRFRSLRYDGMFTPPSLQGSLVYPGNFGVFDWGGVSVDPVRQWLVANPDTMAFISRLIPKSESPSGEHSHGEANGIKYVAGIPFDIQLEPFLSPLGVPCQAPPWGFVAGVDLRSATIAWQHRNGTIRDSSFLPLPFPLGVPSLGGTIVTAGGVAFLSGTLDNYLRAYDAANGRELWKARLPAGGQSTPMSFADAKGRQFVVVTAGGHGSLGTKPGDDVIAYALP
ncbi:membrane-bound PQQ-dependent dehydrogenase, glucose/quinate/shikimate family [Piscinibacter terrae]|uniref:Membrane-bound PQQ-dependent dehydrogenase, glucose/quinate/shikimate family n=1 Tax=Piscinibacter terrae TaxID=2496871 RepID=A0A3N7JUS5_9BURK|nr:membrane-bound PQQ-dependent dehydrogenase, glucose/quinate/shikimate family [Albitalea terrae]RQP22665.1 membrane-bound PQQ-dependent dehydrogenase, glucose/quinate/shikimate family [Albitalea terrae]